MRGIRFSLTPALLAALAAGSVGITSSALAQAAHTAAHGAAPAADAGADRALIDNALSAAPAAVAEHATVAALDGRVLREGTNGFVCMPDMPDVPNNSPMCLDATWREVIDAWMHRRTPTVTQIGFGYMLQGDLPTSNVDPFATAPTAGNQWIQSGGPHVMIVVPDAKALEGLTTDPASGGPFVMWKGTPYQHIMVPAVPRTK